MLKIHVIMWDAGGSHLIRLEFLQTYVESFPMISYIIESSNLSTSKHINFSHIFKISKHNIHEYKMIEYLAKALYICQKEMLQSNSPVIVIKR